MRVSNQWQISHFWVNYPFLSTMISFS